jgi:hypothetical protein
MNASTEIKVPAKDCDDLVRLVEKLAKEKTKTGHEQIFGDFFRERKLPANGIMPSGKSFIGYALHYKCEPLALWLLDQPELAPNPSTRGLLESSIWSARVIKKLIDRGYPARGELRTNQNIMPAILMNGDPAAISILGKNGLPLDQFHIVSVSCTLPYSTLLYTADHSNNGNVLALLKAGSKPDVCDKVGDTFLHKVLKNRSEKRADWIDTNYIDGFRKLLKHCLAKKIPIDVVNREGESALHVAARRGYINSVMALLESGANPALKNNRGCTPAYLAKVAGFRDIEEALHVSTVHQRIQDLLDERGLGRPAPATTRAHA